MNGNKTSERRNRKRNSLPPHSWEAHPKISSGATNKTFLIVLISIALVIILILFLFIGSKFVGKAIEFGGNRIDGVMNADGTLEITATLASGVQTGSIYLELTSPNPDFDLCGGTITNALWEQFEDIQCENNKLLFSDATLNSEDFKSGIFTIAELTPAINNVRSVILSLEVVDMYDGTTGRDLFPISGTIDITVPATLSCTPAAERCDGRDNNCDGRVDNEVDCEDGDRECRQQPSLCPEMQQCVNGACVEFCNQGSVESCGPTTAVGICQPGRRTCASNNQWGACLNATNQLVILPNTQQEACDQRDNDCDGIIDEDTVCTGTVSTTLSITSSAFDNGDAIPADFTCSGRDASPPLTISNIPATARSLALIMDDSYNPALPYIHWVVLNIPLPTLITPATIIEIPAGSVPSGATVLANEIDTANRNTYAGPCPPAGETHTYRFTAYALSNPIANPLSIQGSSPVLRKSTFENSISAGIVSSATLNGVYFPPPVMESPRSGGGFSCTSQWSCPSTWGYCNATLQQSRTCTDLNRCDQRKLTKIENKSCTACEESWICTPWNDCQNGQQTRNCADEHSCGAVLQKPALQKSCQVAAPSGPAPARVQPQLPPPPIQQPAPIPSFWDTYKWFVTGIPAALLVIVLIIFGMAHAFRPKVKPAAAVEYDIEELKEWVQKEKQMGTSSADIETLLAEHTGWSKGEIESKFAELKEAGSSSETVN